MLDYTNLFSLSEYKRNDKKSTKTFSITKFFYGYIPKKVKENINGIKCNKFRKFKNPKISNVLDKSLVFSVICDKCSSKDEKIFKEKESVDILKTLSLITK